MNLCPYLLNYTISHTYIKPRGSQLVRANLCELAQLKLARTHLSTRTHLSSAKGKENIAISFSLMKNEKEDVMRKCFYLFLNKMKIKKQYSAK